MAHTIAAQTTTAAQDRGVFARISAGFADWRAKRREYNRIVRELSAYSLRDLDDIGVAPGDIEGFARRAVYGERG